MAYICRTTGEYRHVRCHEQRERHKEFTHLSLYYIGVQRYRGTLLQDVRSRTEVQNGSAVDQGSSS